MLPYKERDSYYDRPCEVCDETIRKRHEEFAECSFCTRLMCEECTYQDCHVCQDEDDGYEEPRELSTTCEDCMAYCETCDVHFRPSCRRMHLTTCNELGRARRALKDAQERVENLERKTRLFNQGQRQLAVNQQEAQQELAEAAERLRRAAARG